MVNENLAKRKGYISILAIASPLILHFFFFFFFFFFFSLSLLPLLGMLSHQVARNVIDGEKAIILNPSEQQKYAETKWGDGEKKKGKKKWRSER